jgi:4-hydroxy-3-polyprenylbenzoate decarboxylase
VHDATSVGLVMAAGHHGAQHFEKYKRRGEAMPVVMVLGGDPLSFFYGGLEVPYGTFELDVVGGLRGRSVKMVRGRVTGLPIPAACEIALEGFVQPDKTRIEGPFGEWTGHYAGGAKEWPVLDVHAIYHRNDPILVGVPPMGAGPDEMARYRAVLRSATIKENMTRAGVPGVVQVWCHEVGAARSFHGVAIKQSYPGHAVQAGTIAAQCGGSAYASKYVVVGRRRRGCDESGASAVGDGDAHRSGRVDPVLEGAWDSPADPALPPERRAQGDMTHSVAIINACKPYHWRDKFPPRTAPSAETLPGRAREKFCGGYW